MGFLSRALKETFEQEKPQQLRGDIRMISGCLDSQTSADVSNVQSFQLPDPAGEAGGACTSALLNIVYKDHHNTSADLSFTEVLNQMRSMLKAKRYSQVPQMSASREIDVNTKFDLVPENATGTKRAVLVGINYIGHSQGVLSGCHNDVKNMVDYIKDVHGFEEQNITVIMDDGEHPEPTKANIVAAYKKLVEESQPGDCLFCHYSGHGAKIKDDEQGEEKDGYDEVLVPVDYEQAGMIRDDDLFDILIRPMQEGVSLFCLMDCCHSGTVMDLPYIFKADGIFENMEIDENFDFEKLFKKVGEVAVRELGNYVKKKYLKDIL
ncbi:hypothetical protein FisN_3Lh275 [Fistulifera solaris]|uniref:Peptidase C14 caspase domain-containing protein n=1 Tax=Fistulifera solaris TaxID=1519565 RepID=A0A1Z5JPY6_FISSO|nr:hypothetical protein FisN_3Lh275 [Fistulifera solaris]|eukprot:GAX15828.1 hypothetical protein FisN_3Lh275 [Fistulifera solaris]